MWTELDDPRGKAKAALREIAINSGTNNETFVAELRSIINQHKLAQNPSRRAMLKGEYSIEKLKWAHLEYRHAIVQIFTDALTSAQFNAYQLEEKSLVPRGGKMIPRFLLNLNNLDEFGFRPGTDKAGYYQGNPAYAHYPLFEKLLDAFKITDADIAAFEPSIFAQRARNYLLDTFKTFDEAITLIAVGEVQVILFSNPLRVNSKIQGIDTDVGYYQVHGTEEHGAVDANDDDHEDDCWAILRMCLRPSDYGRIKSLAIGYLDIWDDFWYNIHKASVSL
jgi:hypothetical protein